MTAGRVGKHVKSAVSLKPLQLVETYLLWPIFCNRSRFSTHPIIARADYSAASAAITQNCIVAGGNPSTMGDGLCDPGESPASFFFQCV